MSLLKGEKMLFKYTYDFSKQAGALGALSLPEVAGNSLDANCRVLNAYVVVETALTSTGTPTVTFGNTTDPDGYFVDVYALLAGAPKGVSTGMVAGALIWDDTADVNKMYNPLVTNDFNALMTIGAAALTAGKLSFYLEVLL